MPHHYFRRSGVGALRANLANLKPIRDFPLNTPPCSDKNTSLFRGSLDNQVHDSDNRQHKQNRKYQSSRNKDQRVTGRKVPLSILAILHAECRSNNAKRYLNDRGWLSLFWIFRHCLSL